MADHRALSHQANPILPNIYRDHDLHRLHGQNPHVAGDDQGEHWEDAPQPELVGNAVMQGYMRYPQQIDALNYNVAHYHPSPPPIPRVHTYRDAEGAEVFPAQAHPFAPDVQDNRNGHGYGARLHAAVHPEAPPEALPAVQRVQPHAAPPADMPPAHGLRNLAGRFFNNPNALINLLRIEPGPGGRFVVWIALELADI